MATLGTAATRPETAAPTDGFVHPIPRAALVDRVEFLLRAASGRRVIHLGFVDEGRMGDKQARGTWLHRRLADAASELVGLDTDADGVALATELGYPAHVADCQDPEALTDLGLEPAQVVVAGELLEHLDRPGDFLEAVKRLVAPGGELILTTPNAIRLTNALAAVANREVVNPDHVGWHSWRTMETLLGRHGWSLRELAFYPIPPLGRSRSWSRAESLKVSATNAMRRAMRPLFVIRPALADGIVVVARRLGDGGGPSPGQ